MRTKGLFTAGICMILDSLAVACPPGPGVVMPEWYARLREERGICMPTNPIRDAGKKGMFNTSADAGSVLVSGPKKFPVVMIQFPDMAGTYTANEFYQMLFGTWTSGSANDFYKEISYGKVSLDGAVAAWATASHNHNYYGHGNGDYVIELVRAAAQQGDGVLDYAPFDNDGDGYVDNFTVVHAGFGADETGNPNDIWPHQFELSKIDSTYVTNDPDPNHPGQYIKISTYTIQAERSNITNYKDMHAVGVFVHEWGHAFGLPDLYDTDRNDGNNGAGLGGWCLMAGGSWGADNQSPWLPVHLGGWGKIDLGWVVPTVVTANANYTVKQVETNPQVYKLWTNGSPQKEYFLVENRQKTGFDQKIPTAGIYICHIDENVIEARRPNNRVNAGGTQPYGVALEQADGKNDLWTGANRSDAGDLFPGSTGNKAFDNTGTTPDSRSNAGGNTNCGVNKIPATASEMSVYMYVRGGGDTETELAYDENSPVYYVSDTTGNAYAVQFTPAAYPYRVKKVGIYVIGSGNPSAPFDLTVYRDDFGMPGDPWATLPNVHATTSGAWNWFDVSGLNVTVDDGDFYAGLKFKSAFNPRIGVDNGGPIHERSWNYWEEMWWNFTEFDPPLSDSCDLMIRAKGSSTGVEETALNAPRTAQLASRPNPFRASTTIQFQVPVSNRLSLKVYDRAGRLVRDLVDDFRREGAHHVTWDGRDGNGVRQPAGIYFFRLTTPQSTVVRKVVLVQ